MAFNSYDELKAAVAVRRDSILTLEVDLGGSYSPEHEEAKKELQQAKAMKTMTGGAGFLSDNLEALELRVAETRPPANSVWAQYRQLDLQDWAALTKKAGTMSAVEQYESVLPQSFIGLYGVDPTAEDDEGNALYPDGVEPLTTDARSVSSRGGADAILLGPLLHQVVQAFMAWQNSGGEVSIRPTKSGRG